MADLLYHHAKYGGDRGSRAGCRRKIVMFSFLSVCLFFCLSRFGITKFVITETLWSSVITARCICISAVYAGTRCLSVRPSVTFVDHVKTNKDIFEFFSPSGSHTILVFQYQTGCRHSDGNPPPLTGASNARGTKKWRFSINILLYLRNRIGTWSETICKHRIVFPSIQHLAWLPKVHPQGKPKCGKNSDFWTYALT